MNVSQEQFGVKVSTRRKRKEGEGEGHFHNATGGFSPLLRIKYQKGKVKKMKRHFPPYLFSSFRRIKRSLAEEKEGGKEDKEGKQRHFRQKGFFSFLLFCVHLSTFSLPPKSELDLPPSS